MQSAAGSLNSNPDSPPSKSLLLPCLRFLQFAVPIVVLLILFLHSYFAADSLSFDQLTTSVRTSPLADDDLLVRPRVLVLISGLARGGPLAYQSFKRFVLDRYDADLVWFTSHPHGSNDLQRWAERIYPLPNYEEFSPILHRMTKQCKNINFTSEDHSPLQSSLGVQGSIPAVNKSNWRVFTRPRFKSSLSNNLTVRSFDPTYSLFDPLSPQEMNSRLWTGAPWRKLCYLNGIWRGGLNCSENSSEPQSPSKGIVVMYLRSLIYEAMLRDWDFFSQYTHIMYTRSEYVYLCDHWDVFHHHLSAVKQRDSTSEPNSPFIVTVDSAPSNMSRSPRISVTDPVPVPFHFDPRTLYVVAGQDWGGITDRHFIANPQTMLRSISILYDLVCSPQLWFNRLVAAQPRLFRFTNPESVLATFFRYRNIPIRRFPLTAWTARREEDPTWWRSGDRVQWLAPYQVRAKRVIELKQSITNCGYSEHDIPWINQTFQNYVAQSLN